MDQPSQLQSSARPLGTVLARISFVVSGICCALVIPVVLIIVLGNAVDEFDLMESNWWPIFLYYMVGLHCAGLYVFPAFVSIVVGTIALVLPKRYRGPTSPSAAIKGIILSFLLLAWVAYWALEIAPALADAF